MLKGQDILCVSSIDWGFIWQGHQEIMTTLAEHGNRVLFVENTGVRSLQLRDLARLRQRVRNWWQGTKGFRKERDNLFIYSPLILPFPYSWMARRLNRRFLLRSLRRWMQATGFHRPIVWTFLPTPLVHDLIQELSPRLTIYYCIDDLASSSHSARKIIQSEERLFRSAALVFVTSEKLRERAARFRDQVYVFPFGVSYRRFEQVRSSSAGVPSDLQELPRPVAGYVGGIHQWVDIDLLVTVADRTPEMSFALVGPSQTEVSRLIQCPNIHLLGARPHKDLPGYIKGFDVGLIPYRLTEYTANVYPTKLNEYLAMGIPVVATDLPEIRRFNAEHDGIILIAPDAQGFARAIKDATDKNSQADAERRTAVARQNSWEARITQMSALIENTLTARRTREGRWEETLRHLYRTARRRFTQTTIVIVTGYLFLFHTPLTWFVAEPLLETDLPRPADAIIVFAGGVGESGKAGGGYQERVKRAVELYHAEYAEHLVFSSGFVFALQEADVMKALAISLGVPENAILLENAASSTYENVKFVKAILHKQEWQTILLVSSPYHMRRAILTWQQVAPDVEVISVPVRQSRFYSHDSGATVEQMRGILHEYAAIVVYWWKGWI